MYLKREVWVMKKEKKQKIMNYFKKSKKGFKDR